MNRSDRRHRKVLLGMLGVDCHSKGLRTLAVLLRDHGVEVVYVGEHNSSVGMANAVAMEDPDVVGVSFSTSTYLHHTRDFLGEMAKAVVADVPLILGGLIHPDDEPELRAMGVAGIFGPGTKIDDVLEFLDELPARVPIQ
jgi:methylmalonyl-CoA mutase C-terminal domain/subunit